MRKKLVMVALGLVAAMFAFATLASGAARPTVVKFSAALNIGQEVPHPKGVAAGASGHFSATLTGTTLKWTLSYSHLSGPAVAAHIHGPAARGKTANVLIPLCPPCKSPLSGTATATATEIKEMEAGQAYVNVHTGKNQNGEIRGQLTKAM
jgi:CHRD domain